MLNSILPGMDETNEDLKNLYIRTLDELKSTTGEKHFYAAIWMSILRVPKVRNAAFKYLNRKKRHKKTEDFDSSMENSNFDSSNEVYKL